MSATKTRPSVEYVTGLAQLMATLGVTRLVVDDITLERPLPMPEAREADPIVDERERAFAEIQKMSPEAQEHALRMRRMGG